MSDSTDELMRLLDSIIGTRYGKPDSIEFDVMIDNLNGRYLHGSTSLYLNVLGGYQNNPHLALDNTAKGFGITKLAYYPRSATFKYHEASYDFEVKQGNNHFLLSDFEIRS